MFLNRFLFLRWKSPNPAGRCRYVIGLTAALLFRQQCHEVRSHGHGFWVMACHSWFRPSLASGRPAPACPTWIGTVRDSQGVMSGHCIVECQRFLDFALHGFFLFIFHEVHNFGNSGEFHFLERALSRTWFPKGFEDTTTNLWRFKIYFLDCSNSFTLTDL